MFYLWVGCKQNDKETNIMTIDQIKEDKKALEDAVHKLILGFDEKYKGTGVYINDITAKITFTGGHNGIASAKVITSEANIDIIL